MLHPDFIPRDGTRKPVTFPLMTPFEIFHLPKHVQRRTSTVYAALTNNRDLNERRAGTKVPALHHQTHRQRGKDPPVEAFYFTLS